MLLFSSYNFINPKKTFIKLATQLIKPKNQKTIFSSFYFLNCLDENLMYHTVFGSGFTPLFTVLMMLLFCIG